MTGTCALKLLALVSGLCLSASLLSMHAVEGPELLLVCIFLVVSFLWITDYLANRLFESAMQSWEEKVPPAPAPKPKLRPTRTNNLGLRLVKGGKK